jgi:hypothetical protein
LSPHTPEEAFPPPIRGLIQRNLRVTSALASLDASLAYPALLDWYRTMSFVPVVVSPAPQPRPTAILVVEDEVVVRTMLVTRCVDFVVLDAAITYDTDDIRHGDAAIDVVLSDLKRAPRS